MKKILLFSTIIGFILAILIMYIAWEHNPQYAIHTKETIDFKYLITLGLSWFMIGFIAIFSLLSIVKFLTKS